MTTITLGILCAVLCVFAGYAVTSMIIDLVIESMFPDDEKETDKSL